MQIHQTPTYSQASHSLNLAKRTPANDASRLMSSVNEVKTSSNADWVSISAAARELNAQAERGVVNRPVPLPEKPEQPNLKNDYLELKKTQYKYQVAADGVNLATGNAQGLSPASIHYLAKHDQAREQSVMVMAAQSQASLAESFIAQSGEGAQDTEQSFEISDPYVPSLDAALLAASATLLAKQGKVEQVSAAI